MVLEDGSKYILSFEAKVDSDIEKPLRVVVENQDPIGKKNLEEYVNLSNEFQKFTFEFTKKVGSKNQLAFSTGFDENLHHTFTFKNVSLIPAPVQKIDHYLLDEQNGTAGVLTGTEENVKVEVTKVNQQFWDLSLKKRNILQAVHVEYVSQIFDGSANWSIQPQAYPEDRVHRFPHAAP